MVLLYNIVIMGVTNYFRVSIPKAEPHLLNFRIHGPDRFMRAPVLRVGGVLDERTCHLATTSHWIDLNGTGHRVRPVDTGPSIALCGGAG